jgi:hypothetical protein
MGKNYTKEAVTFYCAETWRLKAPYILPFMLQNALLIVVKLTPRVTSLLNWLEGGGSCTREG